MSYLSAISTLINPELIVKGNVLQGEAGCSGITIKGTHVILKTDHEVFTNGFLKAIFTPGTQRKICDYVVVSDEVILICELKTKNTTGMETQLKNTGKFVWYLLEMIRTHGKVKLATPPIKYACFSKQAIEGKQNSKPGKLEATKRFGGDFFSLSCNSIYHLKQF